MGPKPKAKVQARQTGTQEAGKTRPGRSLQRYFLPFVLVAGAVIALIVILNLQVLQARKRTIAEDGARQAAEVMAVRAVETVQGARQLARLLASDPRSLEALGAGDQAREWLAREFEAATGAFLQLRLLPAKWDKPDAAGKAPLGYAGVDLVRRAATGERPPVEVHQVTTGNPYLALAEPVRGSDAVRGVMFAAVPLSSLTRPLVELGDDSRELWLVQETEGKQVAIGSPLERSGGADGDVAIEGTTLRIAYRGMDGGGFDAGLLGLLGLAALGLGGLGLLALLQSRQLASDLRADMTTALSLGEALRDGEPAGRPMPRLRATADALLLLAQYTHAGRGAARVQQPVAVAEPQAEVALGASQASAEASITVEEVDAADSRFADTPHAREQAAIPQSAFRAYDIRGRVGTDLDAERVHLLGQALGTLVRDKGGGRVAVARDARSSSPALAQALIKGLNASGCEVADLGGVPTPVLYFARFALGIDAGVMVTGSHNAPEYNGFKIMLGDSMLAGDELTALRDRMLNAKLATGKGAIQARDLGGDYVSRVTRDVALAREFKIVVDAGNGIAGPLAVRLFEALGCEVIPLYCEPDGSFPHHHPNPGRPENLEALAAEVRACAADLGVAFDGDGDRLAIVDNEGAAVLPDRLLMLLAADVLVRHPGADIIYDVKSSRHLAGFILAHGGRPIMWRSGHAPMKAKLRETGGLLAGEFAGHYFIKERWYGFDDALYTAARVLEVLSADPRSVAEAFAELPASPATPELYLGLDEEGRGAALLAQLAAVMQFPAAKIIDIDGLRVEFADGWGLVRPSNTEPALMFRFEGETDAALKRIQGEFRDWLRAADPGLRPPF